MRTLALAATFTLAPVLESVGLWLHELTEPCVAEVAAELAHCLRGCD